jgi:hypothetical protein
VTIAACYVSPEGVVLAADSASTYQFPTGPHHFNYGQKLFEIGADSTLGLVTWGLGGLELGSYRTLVAKLSDNLLANSVVSVSEVADRWANIVWPIYSTLQEVQNYKALSAKPPFDPSNPSDPTGEQRRKRPCFRTGLIDLWSGFALAVTFSTTERPLHMKLFLIPLQRNVQGRSSSGWLSHFGAFP